MIRRRRLHAGDVVRRQLQPVSRGPEATSHRPRRSGLGFSPALVDITVLLLTIGAIVLYLTLKICGLPLSSCCRFPRFHSLILAVDRRRLLHALHRGGRTDDRQDGSRHTGGADGSRAPPRVPFGHRCLRAAAYSSLSLPAGLGLVPALYWCRQARPPRSTRRHARRQSVTRLAVFIATVGYCGYFPIAPGTVGSAAGLVVYAGVVDAIDGRRSRAHRRTVRASASGPARRGAVFRRHRSGPVVIDEVVGMLITLAFIPVAGRARSPGLCCFVFSTSSSRIRPGGSSDSTAGLA